MEEFLSQHNAPSEMIEKVKRMILRHEVGGDTDQNILKDADSISFLENNIELYMKKYIPLHGYERVKKKFDWMYERITSEQAKEWAQPFYEKGLQLLEESTIHQ